MQTRYKVLSGLVFVLAPALLLGEGCSGEVIGPAGTGATCESICSSVAMCEPDIPVEECAESCQMEQEECASVGASSTFQSFLTCVAGASCTELMEMNGTSCGVLAEKLDAECREVSLTPVDDGSCCDVPPFDVGTDGTFDVAEEESSEDAFDVTPFDVTPLDVGLPEASFEAGADTGADAAHHD